ncbi:MAG TPA: tetratricopeptide repeat protein [Candidatus Binataceae bacterium]|nr:tetratricopeptide repeat protein [Candidatus Binataceae bacterium]
MRFIFKPRRLAAAAIVAGAWILLAVPANAQSLGELNEELSAIEGQMGAATSNPSTGKDVVAKLDHAEAAFAQIASSPKSDKSELGPTYQRLNSMLSQMYDSWKKAKDDCINQIDNGGQCDYTEPEQISLAALYPLSWLRFQGATSIYANNETEQKKLLNTAIDGFTESTLAIFDPNLQRENILGRAFCERELGKFDKTEYQKAIEDFKTILEAGSATEQYKAARQGLATTYMAMGNPTAAQQYANLGTGGGGLMFHLQTLFAAENATHDPTRRAQDHAEIVSAIKATEDDKNNWAISLAAVGKYCSNPVAEFGNSSDPFEKWLLANVLYSVKRDPSSAARYFIEAAHGSSKYAKGYKMAAGIYDSQKRYDLVEQMLGDVERTGGSDAVWAAYMKYKIPRAQWESGGMKNAQLEDQWVKTATDYLTRYPNGENAAELRFRLGERQQRLLNYAEAAKLYEQVSGNNEYSFSAKYSLAECDYLQLTNAAAQAKDKNAPPTVNVDQLRTDTIRNLQEAIRMEPEAERTAGNPQQRQFDHNTRGRAIYMLAGLMQSEKNPDNKQIADMLANYESQYPAMNDKFSSIQEWRIVALSKEKRYDDVQRDLVAIIAKNRGNTTNSDFIKELGLDFWKDAQDDQAEGDQAGYLANAKLAATAYGFFEDLVQQGKTPAKNLTGTLSILGQAYMATGQSAKGEQIFQQVVKADPASPDANAGLARIAQSKKDYKDAVTLWTNVESTAAESDNLWYEAKYNVALIYSEQGNLPGACQKLASTRAEHPTLGTPEMLHRWDALQRKLCLDHKQ